MQPADVVPLTDVSPADWLVQMSTGRQGCVRDYLPEGYQAYLRLPLVDADGEGVPLRQWLGILRDVLARHTATPDRCWFSLWEGWPGAVVARERAGEFACAGVEYPDGCFVVVRRELERGGGDAGRMPARYPGGARLVSRPGNPELAARCREQGSCLEPSLWWPQDRAWVVARDVDSDAVYLAGSRPLAEELLEERRLAAGKVAPDDPITIED